MDAGTPGYDFLNAVSGALGLGTPTVAGYVMALFFTAVIIIIVQIATRGKGFLPVVLESFLMTVLFTLIQWYDPWIGTLLALSIAMIGAFAWRRL